MTDKLRNKYVGDGKLPRVEITRPFGCGFLGLTHMQVCVVEDATDEEILEVCNSQNPSGTSHGWATVVREDNGAVEGPVKCADHPGRLHLLVGC